MTEIPIPKNMDQVTPAWLTQIMVLQPGSQECRIIDRHVEDLNVEAGFISQLARLTLEYEAKPDNLPDSVIVKLPPLDDTTRAISKSLEHFQREVAFYKYFAKDCPANPPKLIMQILMQQQTISLSWSRILAFTIRKVLRWLHGG